MEEGRSEGWIFNDIGLENLNAGDDEIRRKPSELTGRETATAGGLGAEETIKGTHFGSVTIEELVASLDRHNGTVGECNET